MFARTSEIENDFPRVIIYISIRLASLCFSLPKDIINYRDILLVSFFNNNDVKIVDGGLSFILFSPFILLFFSFSF